MSVIAASSVRISTLVDGTLRLVCDVEPRHAQAAFALFASPGTPMALAALKPQSSKPEKVGELCKWAAIRCTDPDFQRWMTEVQGWNDPGSEEDCAELIRIVCRVKSRVELDTNEQAAELFHSLIRVPYAAWLKKQAVTT